jgi:hypothetical protein
VGILKTYRLLKEYLALILENESQNDRDNLVDEQSAKEQIELSLKEAIDDIIDIIEEKDLSNFISYHPMTSLNFDREVQDFLVTLKTNNFKKKYSLENISGFIIYRLKKDENNKGGFFSQSLLKEKIENALKVCTQAKTGLDALFQKAKDDESTDFSETTKDNAPLGKIVFPLLRGGVPFERNTQLENELQEAILDHITMNKPLEDKEIQAIKDIVQGDYYPNWFRESTAKIVFRGMGVSKKYIANILQKKVEVIPARGEAKVSWDFTPLDGRSVSSWSLDEDEAEVFTRGGSIPLVMTARVGENSGKFIDLSRLYAIEAFSSYDYEQEVVGVGPIKIFKVRWGDED